MRDSDRDHVTNNQPESGHPDGEADRILTTEELFRGRTQVLIRHRDEVYRLRITKTGKLILNK